MRRILSVIGACVLFIIVGFLIYQGEIVLSEYSTQLALILTTTAIALLAWGFRPTFVQLFWEKPISNISVEISRSLNPKFKHVEARLFFPHNISREKRDPKQTKPRHKLILIKDLKKAYYVGSYAWNLIITNKIEWFTEFEQDLDEWCKKGGYELIKRDSTEAVLLEPYDREEIVSKKEYYRWGEAILFNTNYRGELTNGFFTNQIFLPEGKTFSNGTNRVSVWAPDTLDDGHYATRGNLDGYINHESRWSWGIPHDAPLGQYRIYMRVHNHFGINNRPIVAQSEEIFTVI